MKGSSNSNGRFDLKNETARQFENFNTIFSKLIPHPGGEFLK